MGKRSGPLPAADGVDLQLPAGGVPGLLGPQRGGETLMTGVGAGRAAPAMFQIGRSGDDPAAPAPLLTRFTNWSAARTAAQTAALIVVAVAVTAGT